MKIKESTQKKRKPILREIICTMFLFLALVGTKAVAQEIKQYKLKIKLMPNVFDPSVCSGKLQDIKRRGDAISIVSENKDMPILKIDNRTFLLKEFKKSSQLISPGEFIFLKDIELTKGEHEYQKFQNAIFDIEWIILEPIRNRNRKSQRKEPKIIFKRVNPVKYLVHITDILEPFWLVFNESFDMFWKVYESKSKDCKLENFQKIVEDYPYLNVKETKHLMKFTPGDVRFLFAKPLDLPHQMINGYANGWYIDSEKLGLGKEFNLVIYYYPQSVFYLGLLATGLCILYCIIFLCINSCNRRIKNEKN